MKPAFPSFKRWLVFTDLDGTLLNHDDYRHDAALPALKHLDSLGIPVIFNTSKTLAELRIWQDRLHNQHPFIIENGSAIVVPPRYFGQDLPADLIDRTLASGQQVIKTGERIECLHDFLDAQAVDVIDFTRCSLAEAMRLTDLDHIEARLAQTREYSVPLVFNKTAEQDAFIHSASRAKLRTLLGGRFLHLLGDCDKGSSLNTLKQLYQHIHQTPFGVVALGDSPNDADMLKQADHAIIVNSPSSQKLLQTQSEHPSCYHTQATAPNGWVEGVQSFIQTLSNHQ